MPPSPADRPAPPAASQENAAPHPARLLRVRSGAVDLQVRTWGDAHHTPIVLVHGYPDSSTVWDGVVARLAGRYYVVAYDVRGAGQSSVPERTADYRLELLIDDLAAVIDAVSPKRPVHLVGHDWGSIQSWEAVTTDLLAGRIASFTSLSGPCLDHVGHWLRQRLFAATPKAKLELTRQLLSSWYIGLFQLPLLAPLGWEAGLGKRWPQFLARREGIADVAPNPTQTQDGKHGVQLYRANFAARALRPQERYAHCPVQLIVPTADHYVSPALFDGLEHWVPRLWRRDINAGHWLPLSHPEELARWLGEFVELIEHGQDSPALTRAALSGERKRFSGKLVVITGAGSGIGRATALAFAEQGAQVIAADIDAAAADQTAEMARLFGGVAEPRGVDVGSAKAMEAFAKWVEREHGAPDIVVNNAGIGMAGPLLDTHPDDWDRLLKVNLWGVIHGSRLFGRQMVAHGRLGHIVNVASAAAYTPTRTLPAYATSKAAVYMLTECLRAELAAKHIGVSAICPGVIDTGIATRTQFVGSSDDEQQLKRAKADRLYKRRGFTADQVAKAILNAVADNQPLALVGAEARAMWWLSRYTPRLARLFARIELAP